MAYSGQQPVVGRYILLDQISGGFNGTTSGFTMSTAGGVQGVKPGLAQNVLLSLGGVIQQPGVDYTISGSGITFTTPPVSGTTFFATVPGDAQSVGTPSDGTVTPASIASGFDLGFPNVNVTGVTTIASGVAATPSLSITGDADTGIFSPAADTLGFATAGVQRLSIETGEVVVNDGSSDVDFRVESNGNANMLFVDGGNDRVGIGTSSPGAKQEILHTSGLPVTSGTTQTHGALRLGASGSNIVLDIGNSGSTGAWLQVGNKTSLIPGNSQELLLNPNGGNVGIGTTSPAHAVHIAGATTPELIVEDTTNNVKAVVGADNTVGRIGTDTNHDLTLRTNDTERMRIDSSGQVGIGTTSPVTDLELSRTGNNADGLTLTCSDHTNSARLFFESTRLMVRHLYWRRRRSQINTGAPLAVGQAPSGCASIQVAGSSWGRLVTLLAAPIMLFKQ